MFVGVRAYLFEQDMQVLYRKQWQREARARIEGEQERTKAQAERWHAVRATFLDTECLSLTKLTDRVRRILSSMGIPMPSKTIRMAVSQHTVIPE